MLPRALIVACVLLLTGCLSLAPRSQSWGAGAAPIDNVPARRWAHNRCAAGALSEVLAFYGDLVSEEQLSSVMPPARHGAVTTVDLLLAARSRGFGAQLLRGDQELLYRELELGRPLIIMLRVMNAPGTDQDLFHYVVLSGVDRERGLVRMHYGDGRQRWVSLVAVDADWAAGGNATFLIGARTPAAATEDDLRRGALLEEEGKLDQAIRLYRFYLQSNPESAIAWTNLGNAQAAAGESHLAEVSYRNALVLDRNSVEALNNLALLLLAQRRLDEAEELARRAAAQESPDREHAIETLNRILAARTRAAADESVQGRESAAASDTSAARDGVPATDDRRYRAAYLWLTAATIFDVESTFYLIDRCPTCQEQNPITDSLVDSGRLAIYGYSALVNAIVMYIAKRLYERGDPSWRVLPIALTVVHALAGGWNIVQANGNTDAP